MTMNIDPNWLLLSMLVSGIGFVLLMYGKRQSLLPHMVAGLTLLIYPYFVSNCWLMTLIAAVLLTGLWLAVRLGW
jgi:uncharacterized membrane protein YjjP (DUF1212 family)